MHIKQLVRKRRHPIFNLFLLHLLRGREEVEPSRLQSDSWSSVHAVRSMLNPWPPPPPRKLNLRPSNLVRPLSLLTGECPCKLSLLHSVCPLGWRPLPTPTSPRDLFETVEEPFSLFVLQAFPGPFSVDIHTICQQWRKVHTNPTNTETSRSAGSSSALHLCTRH